MPAAVEWRIDAWPKLQDKLDSALGAPGLRVRQIKSRGQVFWLKRKERPNLRFRIQKGDPTENFERERAALHSLAENGLPVPDIVAEGADFILMTDGGTPLSWILATPETPDALRVELMRRAGEALAALHASGFSHGRPALRDICLRDGQLRFIDLENARLAHEQSSRRRRDLLSFAHDTFKILGGPCPASDAAFAAYRARDSHDTWSETVNWCQRHRWINFLTRPLHSRRNGRSKDFAAIPHVFALFRGDQPVNASTKPA